VATGRGVSSPPGGYFGQQVPEALHNLGSTVSSQYYADRNLAGFNSRLYANWTERSGVAFQLRVAMYDPASPGWTFVDGNATDGLNHDTSF